MVQIIEDEYDEMTIFLRPDESRISQICINIGPNHIAHGNPPLPLRPTLATPRPELPLSTSSLRPYPNKLLSPLNTILPTLNASRAKISPNPSMTPLMNGKTRLIPRTANIRETERELGEVKRDRVSEGGWAGGSFGDALPDDEVGTRECD